MGYVAMIVSVCVVVVLSVVVEGKNWPPPPKYTEKATMGKDN